MTSIDSHDVSATGSSMEHNSLSSAQTPLYEYKGPPPPQETKDCPLGDWAPDLVEETDSCRTRSSTSSDAIVTGSVTTEGADGSDTHKSPIGESDGYIAAPANWEKEKEMIVTAPYDYLMSHQGKDLRTKLLAALNVWLQIDEKSLDIIQRVVGMLHNASLLVDDIEDGSHLRRGAPVAHDVFGVAQTINCANYVYFLAQKELFTLENWPAAVQVFNEEVLNLHRGQGMDLYWRDTITTPTEGEYLQMVSNKTGGLFRLALKLMQSLSSTDYDIVSLVETLGLLYQILDDVKNLQSTQMTEQKGYCEDFTEGKFSFPIIHAIRNSSTSNNEILNVLRSRPESNKIKSHAVSFMENETKSFGYAKHILEVLHKQAREAIDEIPKPNPAMEGILAKLVID